MHSYGLSLCIIIYSDLYCAFGIQSVELSSVVKLSSVVELNFFLTIVQYLVRL